ncbi:hypothetical protein [Nitrosomonas sp. GH22]|nr:hypothetical protein [Nitrosomonas sp. GH22]
MIVSFATCHDTYFTATRSLNQHFGVVAKSRTRSVALLDIIG